MRSLNVALPALLALLLGVSCTNAKEPAPVPPGFRVEGGRVLDEQGMTFVLRSVNLSGTHKNKPYLSDFGPAEYAHIKELGFNSLRFLVVWAAIEPQKGVYDEAYLAEVDKRIGYAQQAGLKVVIDMHQDLYGEGFAGGDGAPRWTCDESHYAAFTPSTPWYLGYLDAHVRQCVTEFYEREDLVSAYAAMWKTVAARFAARDNVIGFDPMNEPNWGAHNLRTFEPEQLLPLYERVVAQVRQVAPGWLVFMEPSAARNIGGTTYLPKPSFDRVVYAPHSYDRDAEAGKPFDTSRRQVILDNIAALGKEAQSLGAALWIGEYGTQTEIPGADVYMRAQYDAMGAVGAGGAYWAFDKGGGYALLDDAGKDKPILDDVALPFPERVEGTALGWSYDGTSKTMTARFAPTGQGRIEIVTPTRLFPSGATVDCGGCTVQASAGRVVLSNVRGPPAVVSVRPN